MSYSIDVNVLLYASDAGSPHHAKAKSFVEGLAARADVLCLAWPTLMGYLRVATHTAVFKNPLSPAEALQNVRALLALPRARVLLEDDDFLRAYEQVSDGHVIRGNLVPDTHLATILRQHGVETLFTADTDFRRFEFLQVRNPLG